MSRRFRRARSGGGAAAKEPPAPHMAEMSPTSVCLLATCYGARQGKDRQISGNETRLGQSRPSLTQPACRCNRPKRYCKTSGIQLWAGNAKRGQFCSASLVAGCFVRCAGSFVRCAGLSVGPQWHPLRCSTGMKMCILIPWHSAGLRCATRNCSQLCGKNRQSTVGTSFAAKVGSAKSGDELQTREEPLLSSGRGLYAFDARWVGPPSWIISAVERGGSSLLQFATGAWWSSNCAV